jgi:putative transposase
MPISEKYIADFEEEEIFHVYNRTNNKEKLFLTDENRLFFLKRNKEIVGSFADTYCWNLLPNHFHLLIRIKSEKLIIAHLGSKPKEALMMTERKFLMSRVANLARLAFQGLPTFQRLATLLSLKSLLVN